MESLKRKLTQTPTRTLAHTPFLGYSELFSSPFPFPFPFPCAALDWHSSAAAQRPLRSVPAPAPLRSRRSPATLLAVRSPRVRRTVASKPPGKAVPFYGPFSGLSRPFFRPLCKVILRVLKPCFHILIKFQLPRKDNRNHKKNKIEKQNRDLFLFNK